ncbi:MAG: tRNA pseudouridine(55) synthase TruB, partial [Myxococcota bacterium]|nr:tRNA pseudouridine(55) synthase TruB [Myxococcota bacterium]
MERVVGARRAGHGGTLDPAASGLLVVLLGEATKLTPWIQGRDKRYTATVRFGRGTDTLDALGETVAEAQVPEGLLAESLAEVVGGFVGEHLQRPPVYSALKVDGRSHMSRARAGEVVVVQPRPSHCFSIDIRRIEGLDVTLDVHVASGYYVRALARDLGEALGVPAHLAALRRTSVGVWDLSGAVAPEDVCADTLIPLGACIPDLETVMVDAEMARDIGHGKKVRALTDAKEAMVVCPAERPLAVVERVDGGQWAVKRGFFLPPEPSREEPDSLIDKPP